MIAEYTPDVKSFQARHKLKDKDFERWRQEELECLEATHSESETDSQLLAYIEALQTLHKAEYVYTTYLVDCTH